MKTKSFSTKILKLLIILFAVIAIAYMNAAKDESVDFKKGKISNSVDGTVQINENVSTKEFKIKKLSINSFDDRMYSSDLLSKKKIEKILQFKKDLGGIRKVSDLKNIPRISDDDILKLEQEFSDNDKLIYDKVYINKANPRILKYIGISTKNVNKLVSYRKNKKIRSPKELRRLIGNDYNNIITPIVF